MPLDQPTPVATDPSHPTEVGAADRTDARRWPVVYAVFTAWILPATTAQRIGRVPLWKALLIFLGSGVATLLIILSIVACHETSTALTVANISAQFDEMIGDTATEFGEFPYRMIGAFVGLSSVIVGESLFLAMVLTPWGARDERIRNSYGNAVRQVWLHAPHIPFAVALLGTVVVFMSVLEKSWRVANDAPGFPQWVTIVTVPPSDPQFNVQMKAWTDAITEYQNVRHLLPWYVRDGEIVPMAVGFMLASWVLWGMLRAVGAPREVNMLARPPTCERCGYNLTSMEMSARCPECGTPVAESLGSGVRPGTDWQRRDTIGRGAAWWRCTRAAIVKPRALGRQVQLTTGVCDHRSFVAPHLPVLFLVGAAAVVAMIVIELPAKSWADVESELHMFVGVSVLVGAIIPCLTVLGLCASAVLVGGVLSHRYKRNLLGGAMQMASYLTGYLVVWAAFGACNVLLTGYLDHAMFFRALSEVIPLRAHVILILSVALPNAPWVVYYFVLLSRGAAETRYARR